LPSDFLVGYAPGQPPEMLEPGQAKLIKAGSDLVREIHSTTNGTASTDLSKFGLVFAKEPPRREVVVVPLQNENFTLKAGVADTRVDAEMTLQQDVTLWSALPHTHVRGKRWEIATVSPDGEAKTILGVPKYDFNWQTDYVFREPLRLAKGTKLRTSAWYDNSAANKSNPDPTSDVTWGDQTWEEMQFTAFTFTVNDTQTTTSDKGKQ